MQLGGGRVGAPGSKVRVLSRAPLHSPSRKLVIGFLPYSCTDPNSCLARNISWNWVGYQRAVIPVTGGRGVGRGEAGGSQLQGQLELHSGTLS